MKIISGYIENFGCLSRQKLSFGGGLNTVCSANGSGKSTLVAFIKAMLFGIGDTKKASLFENERQRYTPWNKGRFGGSLTIEISGKTLRIERTFGKRPSEDSFHLFDTDRGVESFEYGENIGKALLGIDADAAERTLFLTERNLLPTTDSPALSAALSGAVGNVTEADKLKDALLILDKQRKKYIKKGGGGEIDVLREKIAGIKRKISALDSLILSAKEEDGQLYKINERLSALDSDAKGLRNRQRELFSRGGFALRSFLLILSLALAIAGVISGIAVNPIFYIGAAFFGVLSLAFGVLLRRRVNLKAKTDYEKLDFERADIDTSRQNLLEERLELMRRHDRTLDAIKERDGLCDELSCLTLRLKEAESELFIVKEAAERLKEANESLTKKHLGGAREAFIKYLDVFSASEGLNLDTELKITKTESGETHPYESYSRATRDLYSFAARLAATDAVLGGKCPFIILDDPFSAFDDGRLATALEFLRKTAKSRQIIYLTASKSRLPG